MTSHTQAEPTNVEYRWDTPVGCADLNDIKAGVNSLVKTTPQMPGEIVVKGVVHRATDSLWVLKLELETKSGTIHWQASSEDCEELSKFATGMIALMIGPTRETWEPLIPIPPNDNRSHTTVNSAVKSPHPHDQRIGRKITHGRSITIKDRRPHLDIRNKIQYSLSVFGGVSWGTLPGPFAVLGSDFRIHGNRWQVDFAMAWLPTRKIEFDQLRQANVTMGWGRARFGIPWRRGQLSLLAAAGGEAGFIQGRGINLDVNQSLSLPWIGIPVTFEINYKLSNRMSVGIAFESVLALTHIKILQNFSTVHQSFPLEIRGLARVLIGLQ